MEISSSADRCGKNAVPQRFAVVATAWIVLGSSGGNVCAQTELNQSRVIIPAFETKAAPSMSGFETSLTLTNPPAIFKEQFIGKSGFEEIVSDGPIIYSPAIVRVDPALTHSVTTASFMDQDDGAFEKVTVTDGWMPALPHQPTSVTLWDEIAPPAPVRAPVDVTVHSTPDDTADTEVRTTQ